MLKTYYVADYVLNLINGHTNENIIQFYEYLYVGKLMFVPYILLDLDRDHFMKCINLKKNTARCICIKMKI